MWGIFEDDARRYLDSEIYRREIDAKAKSGDQTAMGIVLTAREMSGEYVAPCPVRSRKRKRQRPEKQKRFGSAALVGTDTDIKEQLTMEKLLNAGDLAEILGFAKRSVVNMAREKPHLLPPYIRVSDSYRWRPSTVQAWMDSKGQQVQETVDAKAADDQPKPKRGRGRPRK